MGTKKKSTPEEIRHLRANPYTRCVTADTISYTLAFKEAFWALSLQGYTGPATFRKLGCNTEVLGFERIHNHNTTKHIRWEAKSLKGLHEGARSGMRLQRETTPADSPSDETARRMQREILVLQQQMAFLKKSCGYTTSRNSSYGQCRRANRNHPGGVGGPAERPHRERVVRIGRCVPLRLLQLGAFRTGPRNEEAEGPGRC